LTRRKTIDSTHSWPREPVLRNGVSLGAGDGGKITGESAIVLDRGNAAEVLQFDLP